LFLKIGPILLEQLALRGIVQQDEPCWRIHSGHDHIM
jgi:hypothetical protein